MSVRENITLPSVSRYAPLGLIRHDLEKRVTDEQIAALQIKTPGAESLVRNRLDSPVRLALNPFISTISWLLPNLVSGSIIVAIVLSLPTAGPLLLQSLMSQDMYLAGAFVLLICTLTLIGSLISDILLALVDPRIRLE